MALILQLEYLDVLWGTGKAEYIRPYVLLKCEPSLVNRHDPSWAWLHVIEFHKTIHIFD